MIHDHASWLQGVTKHSFPLACSFGDLEHALPPGTYDCTDSFLGKFRDIGKSQLMRRQWCYAHSRYCDIFGPFAETELDVSGLPCWDFSLAGNRRGERGWTSTVFMTHAKIHQERQTPLLILENVKAICSCQRGSSGVKT